MKKTVIYYGSRPSSLIDKAIAFLSKQILSYTLEYPLCFAQKEDAPPFDAHEIYVGTKQSNAYVRALGLPIPAREQGYRILVQNGIAVIEGYDDAGVLYGCIDFFDKYIFTQEYTNRSMPYYVNLFEDVLPDFELLSSPSVRHRGVWTWGHVIYDWRGLIDQLVRLKMNTLTIWNDHLPLNAKEIVSYAHECGIKLLWGFSWLWDTDFSGLTEERIRQATDAVLETYEREYRDAGGDGIYFQSFTEVNTEEINGIPVAKTVTDFVNRTAGLLLERAPGLELQFGLHAESVKHKLDLIQNVDPRVRIVWENCGAFPFSYLPNDVRTFDDTLAFVRRISTLRGKNEAFGAVTKGLTKLDWSSFEHPQGPMCIGNVTPETAQNRIERKRKIWRYLQAFWLTNADLARQAIAAMAEETNGDLYVTPLVEDGMLEKQLLFPVALCAEMLWDAHANTDSLINAVALRPEVVFA
ncbi:MAG: hypothetical protein IJW50_10855 [Clostridia bacterium]|nr:hypothetical protein [Clostridia bacterium]MBQ9798202.1 hypothetical protein [Clostridia bacterium]